MIDVHTHPCRLQDTEAYETFQESGEIPERVLAPYFEAIEPVDKAVALAFWAPQIDFRASNDFVAAIVDQVPDRLVGFASVHPVEPGAVTEIERAILELGLKGVKLGPIYQDFDPHNRALWPLYRRIEELGVPMMWHQGTSFMVPQGPLECARPFLLDRIAREFPGIKMVIAHFGYPWSREVVALIRKHPNLYTDLSALKTRPWFLYNALIDALEYGAEGKVLFGSDYPAYTAAETAEALRQINAFTEGTALPRVPEDVIEAIIERDSLALLGIAD